MSRKSDLRVALFLYGQPRFVDSSEAYESIKENILDRYDTTVFAHAWFDAEQNYEPLPSWVTDKNGGRPFPYIPKTAPLDIITKYKPKVLNIETPLKLDFSKEVLDILDERFQGNEFYSHNNMRNIVSQIYSIEKSMQWVLLNFRDVVFDMYIIARYDAVLIDFPDLNSLVNTRGDLFLPEGGHFNDLIQISSQFSTLNLLYYLFYRELLYSTKIHKEVELPIPELYKYNRFVSDPWLGPHKLKKLPMYAEVIRT